MWKSWRDAEKRLICKKDEPNHRVTYDLLEKTDGHGSIIGIMTNCCQRVGENGGSCVEYGMKMPNSGFVTFRYDGKVVGQAWTWCDEKSK